MTRFKKTASGRTRPDSHSDTSTTTGKPATRGRPFFPAATDLPVIYGDGRTTAFHHSGVAYAADPKRASEDCSRATQPLLDPDDFVNRHRQTLVRLVRPLLVRLNLVIRNDELIRVLCTSEHVGYAGLQLLLPCQLGLRRGRSFAMELFLPSSGKPIALRGTVRRLTRTSCDDMARYVVEIDFNQLDRSAERQIASFVYESQLQERPHLPA